MKEQKVILTKIQRKIIKNLQNGWSLICDSSSRKVICYKYNSNKKEFSFTANTLFNLCDKGVIKQGSQNENFNYILTRLGKSINIKL